MNKSKLDCGRYLVVAEDDSVLLIEEGQVVWRREEGLARVQSTLFLDLPAAAADVEADTQALRPSLMDRVNAEVLTVKVSFYTNGTLDHKHIPITCFTVCFEGPIFEASPSAALTTAC